MSSTFDPSKLDLTPENETNKNTISKTEKKENLNTESHSQKDVLDEVIVTSEEKKDQPSENTVISDDDILGNIQKNSNERRESTGTILDDIESSGDDSVVDKESSSLPNSNNQEPSNKKLIDINISSLENIVSLIQDKNYDFVLIEPEDMQVKITFKQDNVDRVIKYIKFPTYTNILFKIKQVTKLAIEDTGSPQEGKGKLKMGSKIFNISSKTSPGQNGERIFISSKEDTSITAKKEAKKTSFSMIFGFLTAILFVGLVLGGLFIAFIVLNANTVSDVQFFVSLGINLNDINDFIGMVVGVIFSILLFISTAVLSVCLFKFFLTKKSLRRRKVFYGIISTILLFTTFGIGGAWMTIDEKIKSLPNWLEELYGDLKIYNNDLLINDDFDTEQALISNKEGGTENIIGPISLNFDLEKFQKDQVSSGVNIKKYIWDFGDETIETFSPRITRLFDTKGNYEITVTAIGNDTGGEEIEQVITNIPSISVTHIVEIDETITNNGGKKISLDANDLSDLGKVVWYFKEPVTESNPNPDFIEWTEQKEGYDFIVPKVLFEELFVGISIRNGEEVDESISRVFVITPDSSSDITGEINLIQDIENELLYTLNVTDAATSFGNGFIENYEWRIEGKTYNVSGDLSTPDVSPEIEHEFETFGEQEIEVLLTDSKGKTEIIKKTFTIQKKVSLRSGLIIRDANSQEIEDIRYEKNTFEYFIDNFGIPSEIQLDARLVRPVNVLYSLNDVKWDVANDGNIDANGKSFNYSVPTEGNHIIVAEYLFVHRKNPSDTITLKEFIYIEGIKKEAILNLKMEYDSNYAPVTVRFDASESFIKNDDIVKFIYDYGDGVSEERDAINPGHKYSEAGDYTITLTVVGETGKRYVTTKELILLPPAQGVKITSSLKKAPEFQGIDFSSSDSSGQIVEYFWDFGDGEISTEANPSHSYDKAGLYTVKLKVDFANKNSISDEIEIEIFEEK